MDSLNSRRWWERLMLTPTKWRQFERALAHAGCSSKNRYKWATRCALAYLKGVPIAPIGTA